MARLADLGDLGEGARVEEVVLHELDDQGHVDVHRALELGQGADVARRHLEVHVVLEALGGDDVPQQVDHLFALAGHLHLDQRVVEQIAPVLGRGGAQVVGAAQGEELHGDQPAPGVGEELADVGEVGDLVVEQAARGGVVDRLVEGVGADADRGPAEVELADVDGVERGVPGFAPTRQDVRVGYGVVAQGEMTDVVLRVADVLDAVVALVAGIDDEEDVVVRPRPFLGDLAEDRDQRGVVGVADVVLLAPGEVAAVGLRVERHLARVEIGAVLLLREAEGEDAALLRGTGRSAA